MLFGWPRAAVCTDQSRLDLAGVANLIVERELKGKWARDCTRRQHCAGHGQHIDSWSSALLVGQQQQQQQQTDTESATIEPLKWRQQSVQLASGTGRQPEPELVRQNKCNLRLERNRRQRSGLATFYASVCFGWKIIIIIIIIIVVVISWSYSHCASRCTIKAGSGI